jgi:hypothetical protein
MPQITPLLAFILVHAWNEESTLLGEGTSNLSNIKILKYYAAHR